MCFLTFSVNLSMSSIREQCDWVYIVLTGTVVKMVCYDFRRSSLFQSRGDQWSEIFSLHGDNLKSKVG